MNATVFAMEEMSKDFKKAICVWFEKTLEFSIYMGTLIAAIILFTLCMASGIMILAQNHVTLTESEIHSISSKTI